MNILSRYFALWVKEDHQASDLVYSAAYSGSLAIAMATMPMIGVLSDTFRRRMPFLIGATLLSVSATAAMGLQRSLLPALFLFALANFGYQVGFVAYNALLPDVAETPERTGTVASYAVALGYAGAIVGLLAVQPLVRRDGNIAAFLPTAGLYLLFSLPCFIAVRDRDPKTLRWEEVCRSIPKALRRIRQTFREAESHRPILLFLLANVIFSDAINTITLFMSVYLRRVVGFQAVELDKFLILSIGGAFAGAALCGRAIRRWGARSAMFAVLWGWLAALGATIAAQGPGPFWIIGPITGMCFGGTWVAGKTLVVLLSPAQKLGEFFGLYGLTEKFTAVLGPLLWGVTVSGVSRIASEQIGYRLAVFQLLVFVAVGMALFQRVPMTSSKPSR